eukprot:3075063-Rhodomonas_salina.1
MKRTCEGFAACFAQRAPLEGQRAHAPTRAQPRAHRLRARGPHRLVTHVQRSHVHLSLRSHRLGQLRQLRRANGSVAEGEGAERGVAGEAAGQLRVLLLGQRARERQLRAPHRHGLRGPRVDPADHRVVCWVAADQRCRFFGKVLRADRDAAPRAGAEHAEHGVALGREDREEAALSLQLLHQLILVLGSALLAPSRELEGRAQVRVYLLPQREVSQPPLQRCPRSPVVLALGVAGHRLLQHLPAATALHAENPLWTHDRRVGDPQDQRSGVGVQRPDVAQGAVK